jgi:hypothetical protein
MSTSDANSSAPPPSPADPGNTATPPSPSAAVPAQSFEEIAIDDIVIDPHRGRKLNEAVVADLMRSIARNGLLEPILVTPIGDSEKVDLVAGRHRLEACKQLKHERINAVRLEGIEELRREEIEIAENLVRAELSPAERGLHLLRLKEIYETMHPETRKGAQGGGRGGKGTRRRTGSAKLSFSASIASKTGRSKRSTERDVRRAKLLGEDVERIKGTALDSRTEMDALATLSQEDRAPLIERAQKGERVSAAALVAVRRTAGRLTKPNGPRGRVKPQAVGAASADVLPLINAAALALDELRAALSKDGAADQLRGLPTKHRKDFVSALQAVAARVEASLA